MFNSMFLFQITSATPYAKEVKGKTEKGIRLTGIHMTDDRAFLEDIELVESAKQSLDEFLSKFNKLPIDGEVGLKFSKQKDLVLIINKSRQSIDLKSIKVRKGKSRMFDVKIIMLLKNLKSHMAAHIYENFKETEEVTIEKTQEELPLKEQTEGQASTPVKKADRKSRRIPKNTKKK